MVEDRGVDGGKHLQTSHSPEPQHRPFSSSERQVRVLRSIVHPLARFLQTHRTDLLEGRAVRSKQVSDDSRRPTVTPHRFLVEFQCGFLVPLLCDEAFKDLTLVIDRPPEIMSLAVDLHEHLVEMPAPLGPGTQTFGAFPADFSGEHQPKPVPPETDGFVANIDAALVQQILDISQRQRKPNVEHHRQADDLLAGPKVLERVGFLHSKTLRDRLGPAQQESL